MDPRFLQLALQVYAQLPPGKFVCLGANPELGLLNVSANKSSLCSHVSQNRISISMSSVVTIDSTGTSCIFKTCIHF